MRVKRDFMLLVVAPANCLSQRKQELQRIGQDRERILESQLKNDRRLVGRGHIREEPKIAAT